MATHIQQEVPTHVDLSTLQERKFWCKYFNCSEAELTDAVIKMGKCTSELKLYLKGSSTKNTLQFWATLMK